MTDEPTLTDDIAGGDVIALVDAERWDVEPQLAYANGWNDRAADKDATIARLTKERDDWRDACLAANQSELSLRKRAEATPDLYAALEELMECQHNPQICWDRCLAALAKAREEFNRRISK